MTARCPLCNDAHSLSQCPRWRVSLRAVCTNVVRDAPRWCAMLFKNNAVVFTQQKKVLPRGGYLRGQVPRAIPYLRGL